MTLRKLSICFQFYLQNKWDQLSYIASFIHNSGYVKKGITPSDVNPLSGKDDTDTLSLNLKKESDKKLLRSIFSGMKQ